METAQPGEAHTHTAANSGCLVLTSPLTTPGCGLCFCILSVAVLAGELLREAEKLIDMRIHPMIIVQGASLAPLPQAIHLTSPTRSLWTAVPGYRDACKIALAELKAGAEDHAADADKFKDRLMKIARTTLSSKLLTHERDWFAALAVDAVTRIKGSLDLELIQIIKKPGGSMRDSYLEEGFLMDKEIGVGQPKRIKNAKIMVANTSMDTDKVKVWSPIAVGVGVQQQQQQ